ncbi:MAG: neutral/alkaline non-lysosomal ceramidase N-terminal domain-containing protein [Cyclobacteriaceae bacterium]
MQWYWKTIIGFLASVILLANILFTWLDRTPYKETEAYQKTKSALDRYYEYRPTVISDSLQIGWSSASLIPSSQVSEAPLAGYGARKPKYATGLLDSVKARTTVVTNGNQKIALVSAELLIIHPEVANEVYSQLETKGWSPHEIYFGATHTHSSIGAWAPGLVGNLFAGSFDKEMVTFLGRQIASTILGAEENSSLGGYSFLELDVPDFIFNRLARDKGIVDPYLTATMFLTENGKAIDLSYGAHATCFNHNWKKVTGDYPAILTELIRGSSQFVFANFRAGAVASMGPARNGLVNKEYASWIAKGIHEELKMPLLMNPSFFYTGKLEVYKLPLYLEDPQLKITNNLKVRPWLFRQFVGEYPVEVSVASIDSLLMIGLPCDFSGELAVPLYEYAQSKNLSLRINSFNGGYIGYVPHDQWYDLNKYETRTMSWYGHDMGAYLTDIIMQIINQHAA